MDELAKLEFLEKFEALAKGQEAIKATLAGIVAQMGQDKLDRACIELGQRRLAKRVNAVTSA